MFTNFYFDNFRCGLAYELKKPSKSLIKARQERSGDGSDNRLVRVSKIYDWIIGISITSSQLLVSFALRFIILNIKHLLFV